MILYLLPFMDGKHFKFGYTETQRQGFARIRKIHYTYQINFQEAKVVSAIDRKAIINLEKQFKSDYSRFFMVQRFIGRDGFSEVLPIKYLKLITRDIEVKAKSLDWLGLEIKKYPVHEKAAQNKAFVHSLNLRTVTEWRQYCKSGKKPDDIPTNPHVVYKNKGWINYGDWLGTGRVASGLKKFIPFKAARKFAHSLNLGSQKAWQEYCKSGKKLFDIPSDPYNCYKNSGWKNWGDWVGTGNISVQKMSFRSFRDAKAFAHSLNIKSESQWRMYCREGKKPFDIPANPRRVYKNEGWISFGDWLGTETIAPQLRIYRSFKEARDFVHILKLNNGRYDWREYCKSGKKPFDIPSDPYMVYKNSGWINWENWIGNETINIYQKRYRPYFEARKLVHNLKLKTIEEWKKYCQSGKKPRNIPYHPERAYKKDGWKDFGDWLGTKVIANYNKKFQPYNKAREIAHKLRFTNVKEWQQYCKNGDRPANIPACPNKTYKGKGWKNWGDWLGTGIIALRLKNVQPFIKAKDYVRCLNFKNKNEWASYCVSGKKPDWIPSRPDVVFKNKGWKNWGDWLGSGTIASRLIKYRQFYEAKSFVKKVNF